MKVPFLDLKGQYAAIKSDVDAAIAEVLSTMEFVGGRALKTFETAFAEAHHVKHCIGVGNGTDAIVVVLRSLGIGPGDAVVTAANSFIASSEAITLAGARPVFIDCNADYTMDVAALQRRLERTTGPRIKAVIPVHLYGRTCDLNAITELARRFKCAVISDAAQAHLAEHDGKPIATLGDVTTFSFYPGKNLGAYGDAGAIVTNDDALAERMRMYANHGRKEKYDHLFEGTNSRLDNLQAAVLGVKLGHLRGWTSARIAVADRYRELLADTPEIVVPKPAAGFGHVYHLFVVRVPNRERVRERLKEDGIDTGVHYPMTLPNLAAYRYLEHTRDDFPNASAFEPQILSLPMFPEITAAQIEHVATCLKRAVRG